MRARPILMQLPICKDWWIMMHNESLLMLRNTHSHSAILGIMVNLTLTTAGPLAARVNLHRRFAHLEPSRRGMECMAPWNSLEKQLGTEDVLLTWHMTLEWRTHMGIFQQSRSDWEMKRHFTCTSWNGNRNQQHVNYAMTDCYRLQDPFNVNWTTICLHHSDCPCFCVCVLFIYS